MATPADLPLKRYLALQIKTDREVLDLLRSIKRDVDASLRSMEGSAKIGAVVRREQLRLAQRAIDDAVNAAWIRLADVIEKGALVGARDAVLVNGEFDRALVSAGLSGAQRAALLDSNIAQSQQAVRHALNRRFDTTGATRIPLSEKVYRSRNLVKGEVDRMVESALARGLSAKEFAADIRQFVNPNTPGGVRYAAMRLSRTEINNAFHFAQTRDNAMKPWVNGQKWYLSGSHPKPDECNDFAEQNRFGLGVGVFPKEDVPNKPHPHCLCYITPETVSEEEWLKQFKAGQYDDYLDSRMPVGLPEKALPKPKAIPETKVKVPSSPVKAKYRNADLRGLEERNAIRVNVDYDLASVAEKARARDAIIKRASEDVHIRMRPNGLEKMLQDGRYKTVHENAELAGQRSTDYVKVRTAYEDAFMDYKGAAAKDRPIYGYTGPFDQGSVSGYGDYTVTLKRSIRKRITVSAGDSLNGALDVHTPGEIEKLSEARLKKMLGSDNSRGLLAEGEWTQFMEAQIHGGVTLADIDFVTIPSDAPQSLLDALKRHHIKVKIEKSEEDKALEELLKRLKG
jgi:hypothetical protein